MMMRDSVKRWDSWYGKVKNWNESLSESSQSALAQDKFWWLTSTPGSMLMLVICLTISDGLCRSITLLWILIWNLSQVLLPSPQGVFKRTSKGLWTLRSTRFTSLQVPAPGHPDLLQKSFRSNGLTCVD